MGIPVPRDLQAEFNAKIRALFDKVADAINKEHPSHQDFDFDGFIEGFDEDSPLTQEVFEYLVKDSALRHWNSNPPAMITSSSSSSLAPSTGTRPAVIHRPARDSFSDWLSFRPPLYSTPPLPPPRPPRRQYTIHHHQNPAPLRAPASALGSGTTLPPHLPAAVTTTDVPLGTTTFTTSSSDFTNEHEVQDSTPDDHTAFTPANSTPRPTRSNSNSSVYRNTFVDHRDDFGPDVELDYPLRRSIFTAPHRRRPAFIPVASSTAPSTTLNSFWDDAATSGDEFLNNNDTNTNNIGVGESDSDDSDEIDSVEMQRTLLEDSSSGDRFRPLRSSTNRSIRDARRVFNERLNRTIFNEADEEEDTAATTTLMQQGQQAGLPSDTTTPQPRRRGFSGSAVVPSPLSRRPTLGQVLPTYGRMSLPSWPQSSSTSSSTSLSPSLSSSALDGRASRTASYSFSQIEAFRRATESLQRDIQSLRSQVAATQASFAAQRSHNSTNNSSGNNNDRGYYSSNSFGSAFQVHRQPTEDRRAALEDHLQRLQLLERHHSRNASSLLEAQQEEESRRQQQQHQPQQQESPSDSPSTNTITETEAAQSAFLHRVASRLRARHTPRPQSPPTPPSFLASGVATAASSTSTGLTDVPPITPERSQRPPLTPLSSSSSFSESIRSPPPQLLVPPPLFSLSSAVDLGGLDDDTGETELEDSFTILLQGQPGGPRIRQDSRDLEPDLDTTQLLSSLPLPSSVLPHDPSTPTSTGSIYSLPTPLTTTTTTTTTTIPPSRPSEEDYEQFTVLAHQRRHRVREAVTAAEELQISLGRRRVLNDNDGDTLQEPQTVTATVPTSMSTIESTESPEPNQEQ